MEPITLSGIDLHLLDHTDTRGQSHLMWVRSCSPTASTACSRVLSTLATILCSPGIAAPEKLGVPPVNRGMSQAKTAPVACGDFPIGFAGSDFGSQPQYSNF